MIDVNETVVRLRELKAGESFVYYRGYMAKDCNMRSRFKNDLRLIRAMALSLSERGQIALVHRRIGPFDYEYIAQGATPRTTPVKVTTH